MVRDEGEGLQTSTDSARLSVMAILPAHHLTRARDLLRWFSRDRTLQQKKLQALQRALRRTTLSTDWCAAPTTPSCLARCSRALSLHRHLSTLC